MSELFKSKVRSVGSSLGILIPKKIIESDKIKAGDEVEVSLFLSLSKAEREKMIDELFGWAKRAAGKKQLRFERDRVDRIEGWLK